MQWQPMSQWVRMRSVARHCKFDSEKITDCSWTHKWAWNLFQIEIEILRVCDSCIHRVQTQTFEFESEIYLVLQAPFCLHWSCSPSTVHAAAREQLRSSNLNTGKMDQTWSSCMLNFWAWFDITSDLSEYQSATREQKSAKQFTVMDWWSETDGGRWSYVVNRFSFVGN